MTHAASERGGGALLSRAGALALCLGAALLLHGGGLAGAAPAPAPAIVFPPDKALLDGSGAVEVLGFRPEGAPATLTVRGKDAPRQYTAPAGAFKLAVTLEPGESSIEFGEKTVKVFLAVGAEKAPAGFSPADTHAVDNGCEECHAVSTKAMPLVEKAPALCSRCHDDTLKGEDGKALAVLHPPAEEGDCFSCHRFHGRAIRQLPPQDKRDLCFGCHDDFSAGKKRSHAPVAKGECTGCHRPHGAPGEKLLPATGVKLCLLCHADPSHGKDGKTWAAEHPALDDGCPSCHLPHVSDEAGLLKKPQAEVCADCHDPFPSEEGGKELLRHSPVDEGSCSECHAVHGGDEAKLLAASGKALCVKCHDDPTVGADGEELAVPHPALDDGCPSCHLPHVSPQPALLKKPQAALCFDCHDRFVLPEGSVSGSLHRPVLQGKCGGCHAPHGSAIEKLLVAPKAGELCLKCHKDPKRTPDGAELPVQHAGLDDGCGACHQPHLSPAGKLLNKPQREVCLDCHEDKNVNADGAEWAVPHPPVSRGLCSACHGPHGAREKALLLQPSYTLCAGSCHTEVHERHRVVEIDPATGQPASGKATIPTNFPMRKDGTMSCVGCHLPHGSDAQKLWTADDLTFCSACHKKY